MRFRPTLPRKRCSPEFFRFLPLPEPPDSCVKLNPAVVMNDCRSVELRALCNEVPRTPPGPEGSNGTGNTSGAAYHPKFLAATQLWLQLPPSSESRQPAVCLSLQLKTFSARANVRNFVP